jgi:glycosyltransferase involved in cell wall biosynthesis
VAAVGVIVPAYNVSEYLGTALESVLARTFADFEVLVVDDESPDDAKLTAAEIAAGDPSMRLIRQENRGLAGARNRALEDAT